MTDPQPPPLRTLCILCAAALMFATAQTAIVPAIATMQRALDTTASGVTWVVITYLVSAAVFTPIVGRLGDMYGKQRLLVIALACFAGGNLVAAVGDSLPVVIAGRALQGVAGGTLPLCFSIIRDELPAAHVRTSIGIVSAILGVGTGLGFVMGGIVVDHASYQAIFWINTVAAVLVTVAIHVTVPESPWRSPGRIDVAGATLLAIGVVAVLLATSQANSWGWTDPRTLAAFLGGLTVLVVFIVVERRISQPLANIATLRRRPVLLTNVATLLIGFGLFGTFLLIPQLAEAPVATGYGLGLSATTAALLMVPGTLVMLVFASLSGAIGRRCGSHMSLSLGAAIAGAGQLALAFAHDTELEIILGSAILNAGFGLAFAAMPNLIVESVPQEETGEATGVNALVRSVGSSLGAQVAAAVVAGWTFVGGYPGEGGYSAAFLVCAGVALLAAVTALTIPSAGGAQPGAAEPHAVSRALAPAD